MNNLGIHTSYKGSSSILEFNSVSIDLIKKTENWNDQGEYVGTTSGMIKGQTYVDVANKIKYEYTGVTVIRFPINVIVS
jgi:hypothetical protein